MSQTTLIALEGVCLLGVCAGVIGCFAVLRRRALTGDALSHAALPGVFSGYLFYLAMIPLEDWAQPPPIIILLLGALATGVLGILIITLLRRFTRIKEDAAIGIVLSVFFGAGIVLRSIVQRIPEASRAGLESFILGTITSMTVEHLQALRWLTLGSVAAVLLLYKEFKLMSFDSAFARVQGWPIVALDFVLMLLIALVVIVGLPAVGVMLMAGLLILPAAAARFWTERLWVMILLSAAFGLAAGGIGVFLSAGEWQGVLARWLPPLLFLDSAPAGPTVTLIAAGIFVISILLAPRRGALTRLREHRRFRQDLQRQKGDVPA
jgi:manganese/zinc/iron transport system permease protein